MKRRLLCCLAHPDDETFLAGGTLRRASEEGVETSLVTATRGESGKTGDPPVCSREDLGSVRENELNAASRVLGIPEVSVLGYRDRELAAAPVAAMRQALVASIRRFRPHVVLTFDPNGSNGHPDHVAISRFTSDALAAAADPRWFPEAGEAWAVPRLVWSPPLPAWEIASLGSPPAAVAGVDFVINVGAWVDAKLDALACHRTQNMSANRIFLNRPDRQERLSLEAFRQAWGPALPSPAGDLFAGLDALGRKL